MTTPLGYIAKQREFNTCHLDGSIESPNEEALIHAKTLREFVSKAGVPLDSFLDVGCRTGYVSAYMQEVFPCARVCGVDIVPEFVSIAQTRAEAVVGDMHSLPFADREFDWLFCVGTIEHAYNIRKVISEIFRVARVGVYLTADLGPEEVFKANGSHYFHDESSRRWANMLLYPGWEPLHFFMRNLFDLNAVFLSESTWMDLRKRACEEKK